MVDCLLICLHMYRDLTTTWRDEIVKNNMLAHGDRAKVEFLFPMHGLGDASRARTPGRSRAATRRRASRCSRTTCTWSIRCPGIWYMTHLEAPGLNVAGVALPGVPGVIVGHNQRIAWGITNLHFDVQDLYIEKLDDRTGRYLFRGQVEQARGEREIIRVKGQAAVEMTIWVTRHGPIFLRRGQAAAGAALDGGRARHAAISRSSISIARRTGRSSRRRSRACRDRDRTSCTPTWTAISAITPPASCRMRRGYRGDVPVDGSSGNFEWDGYIPFDELPSVYNPPSGMIVTANQNPFPGRISRTA